jgi:hypothetical protein
VPPPASIGETIASSPCSLLQVLICEGADLVVLGRGTT